MPAPTPLFPRPPATNMDRSEDVDAELAKFFIIMKLWKLFIIMNNEEELAQ